MNDSTFVNDNQAVLLDAQACAEALAERYQQAISRCRENAELVAALNGRQRALKTLANHLLSLIENRGLLPKDSHNEREDLAQLFDTLRSFVDDDQHQRLRQALAEQESMLQQLLEAFHPRDEKEEKLVEDALKVVRSNSR